MPESKKTATQPMIRDRVRVPGEFSVFCHFFRKLNSLNLLLLEESSTKFVLDGEGKFWIVWIGLKLVQVRKSLANLILQNPDFAPYCLSDYFFPERRSIPFLLKIPKFK